MNIGKKCLLIAIILVCCVGCDQVTKKVAKQTLQGAPPRTWFHNTVRLHYTENTGAFLGLGATLSEDTRFWMFLVLPGLMLCGTLAFGIVSSHMRGKELLMLSCFVGGGLSNLLDRALQDGKVADFLNIGISTLRTGIFNVADVLIMFGVVGLVLVSVLPPKERSIPPTDSMSL